EASAAASEAASAAPSEAASAAPPADVEKELFMYNWAAYVSPDNMELFKERFGVETFTYDVYDNNEVLIAKLQGGASGYDIAAPTAEYVPGMVEEGFLQKLDKSRIPNTKYINDTFKGLWWDPNDEYQVPKDYGTTGILYRKSLISKIPESWREFYDMIKGEASGKTVFVDSMGDVFVMPLKMLGYSLNSVDPDELNEARTILLDIAPHLYSLDSNTYQTSLKDGSAVLALGWTGPLGQELLDEKTSGEAGYVVPSEGTLFWMDTWVMLADAPHPNAAYAWLNFIHEPEVQGEETNYNLYATTNDAAKEFVRPEILADSTVFPPDNVIASLEGAQDTSGNNQRIDIWEEFKQAVGG
ncbi:MAG TPA: spermidine/putrescine ABC transporter substrate-binding protein, partial [Candidatus Limnocylindrales bacterium]|nr:spermidine/putrescine ABC transporter substrate-binding protein [Candidatus Limnocylindrales bacterium]